MAASVKTSGSLTTDASEQTLATVTLDGPQINIGPLPCYCCGR